MAEQPSYSTTKNGKRLIYIDGVGWRYATEHRMTRWPLWKDSRKPGTYMITLNINGSQKLLGTLAGSSAAIYGWMKEHPEEVKAASADAYYYRHALLGTGAMPFVLKPVVETTGHKEQASDKAQPAICKQAIKPPIAIRPLPAISSHPRAVAFLRHPPNLAPTFRYQPYLSLALRI